MFSQELLKLTWGGDIASEDEWTNGIHIGQWTETALDPVAAFEEFELSGDIATALAAAYGGANTLARYENLRWIKLSVIGEDGKVIGEPKYYDYTTPVIGTTTIATPPQDSIVVTLTTDKPRGLANKGRIYLPSGFADVQGTDGRISPSAATSIANRFATLMTAINTYCVSTIGQYGVGVASSVGAGAFEIVTGVAVGNLIDTQRRRRNRLTETYTSAAVTPSA